MTLNIYKNNVPPTAGRGFILIALAGALFALSTAAFAVDPPPGGGYSGNNTATGDNALFSLDPVLGTNNTANGFNALYSDTTGYYNTATGALALYSNTTGYNNVADGILALYFNTTGQANTALGSFSLTDNTTGNYNTATGNGALRENLTGTFNTALGFQALFNMKTGSNNIAVGSNAGNNASTGSNNIYIGNVGVAGESNKIRVGTQGVQTATFITGIYGVATPNGLPVSIRSDGRLGVDATLLERIEALESAVANLTRAANAP